MAQRHDVVLLKRKLAVALNDFFIKSGLKQYEIAAKIGTTRERVSRLRRMDLEQFSMDMLFSFLARWGHDVSFSESAVHNGSLFTVTLRSNALPPAPGKFIWPVAQQLAQLHRDTHAEKVHAARQKQIDNLAARRVRNFGVQNLESNKLGNQYEHAISS